MIRIERMPPPSVVNTPEFQSLKGQLESFHREGGTRKRQLRFSVQQRLAPFMDEILDALHGQFGDKCAYTEVPGASAQIQTKQVMSKGQPRDRQLHMVWHRPTGDAVSPDGQVDALHYWWLALEWDNWYLASRHVESVKHDQFPVVGERSPLPETGTETPTDDGVLLDPCLDYPHWWLRFGADGRVEPRGHPSVAERKRFAPFDRGEETIRILDLNNVRLIESRAAVLSQLRDHLESGGLEQGDGLEYVYQLPGHTGAALQVAVRELLEKFGNGPRVLEHHVSFLLDRAPDSAAAELMTIADASLDARARHALQPIVDFAFDHHPDLADSRWTTEYWRPGARHAVAPPMAAPEPEVVPEVVIQPTDRISSIYVKNFRAITEAQIDIESEMLTLDSHFGSEEGPLDAVRWKMLLGENGSGKSSFLQAVALALSGEAVDDVVESGQLKWSDLLRRTTGPDKPTQGRVVLQFTGGQKIDLRFTKTKAWFHGLGGRAPQMNLGVRAYGATRLLSKPGDESGRVSDAGTSHKVTSVIVSNLFDPHATVLDAKSWLCMLEDGPFNTAALTLGELLGVPPLIGDGGRERVGPDVGRSARIARNPQGTEVLVDGDRLEQVSDGYQSVIAIACDIMAGIGGLHLREGGFGDLANARGIVMIDEIGAHLHPRWRMEITDKLRRALPNVQFIATTHEPLCLRGLEEREVVKVMKHERHGVVVEEIDRAPARYRVDQLLTSEFFGLDSAVDPELDARFQRYYELRRKTDRSEDEQSELGLLDRELNQRLRPILGYTRRDQLVYEAVDEFLAEQNSLTPEDRQRRRRETIDKVKDLWRATDQMMVRGGQ